jgi:hypothetical protein
MDNLTERIQGVINRARVRDRAAVDVLADLGKDFVLVPRSLVERAAKARGIGGAFDRQVISNELARYADLARDAPEGDSTP